MATNAVALGIQGGSLATLSQSMLSNSTWISVAFIYTAQTGLNYRRYKKGQIDKKEFWHRMRLNSVVGVGSTVVGSGGAAAGFALGTAVMPGIGSIIGAVVGGLAGGFAGERLSATAYKHIEHQIQEAKAKKKKIKKENYFHSLESTAPISHERFDEALCQLSIHDYTPAMTLAQVEQAYLTMLELVTEGKRLEIESNTNTSIQEGGENGEKELNQHRQEQYCKKYEELYKAMEDIKTYMIHYGLHVEVKKEIPPIQYEE